MGRTGVTSSGSTADLARSSRAELDLAWQHRQVLVAAAGTLVVAAGHDPDVGTCDEARCGLATVADAGICEMAHRLARLPGGPPVVATASVDVALAGFLTALVGAADAIRHCRQTAHATAGCWFSPAAGLDGCGDVLRLMHRCG